MTGEDVLAPADDGLALRLEDVELAALLLVVASLIEALPPSKRTALRAAVEHRLDGLERTILQSDVQAVAATAGRARLAHFRAAIAATLPGMAFDPERSARACARG